MSRVALVNPVKIDALSEYSGHLGLSYVSSFLKAQDHKAKVFDINMSAADAESIHQFNPEYIGITVIRGYEKETAELIKQLRKKASWRRIIIGGPEPTIHPEECLKATGADFAVRGGAIPAIAHILNDRYDNKGVCYQDGNEFIDNGIAEYMVNDWRIDPSTLPDTPSGTYCTIASAESPTNGNNTLVRDIGEVVEDMEEIDSEKEAELFFMWDRDFLVYPKRVDGLDHAMREIGLPQKVAFKTKPSSVLEAAESIRSTVHRIKEVHLGNAALVDEQIKRMGEDYKASSTHDAVEFLRLTGIMPVLHLYLGDRETGMDELRKISDVFSKHPEYLLLVGSASLKDEGEFEYPAFMQAYLAPWDYISRFNQRPFAAKSRRAFMKLENPSKKKKFLVETWFDDFHKKLQQIVIGDIGAEKGIMEAKGMGMTLTMKLQSLYS